MGVKFNLVRIDSSRKKFNSEIILKQNTDLLISNLRAFIENKHLTLKNKNVSIDIVIPEKGDNIKNSFTGNSG